MTLAMVLGIGNALTCSAGTTISEDEEYYIYSWNETSPIASIKAVQTGSSGATYFMGYISNNQTTLTVKENSDGTVQWAQNYYPYDTPNTGFIVDNSENFIYTVDIINAAGNLKLMKQDASTGVMIKTSSK